VLYKKTVPLYAVNTHSVSVWHAFSALGVHNFKKRSAFFEGAFYELGAHILQKNAARFHASYACVITSVQCVHALSVRMC